MVKSIEQFFNLTIISLSRQIIFKNAKIKKVEIPLRQILLAEISEKHIFTRKMVLRSHFWQLRNRVSFVVSFTLLALTPLIPKYRINSQH